MSRQSVHSWLRLYPESELGSLADRSHRRQPCPHQAAGVGDAETEPVLAALLLGKSTKASERGVRLVITEDTAIDDIDTAIEAQDLVTILGNLIDNAVDAAIAEADRHGNPPQVVVTARTDNGELMLRVADNGPGVDPGSVPAMFRRGWTTKTPDGLVGHGLGLALVGQAVRHYRGSIDVRQDVGAVFTVLLPLRRGRGENM